MGKGQAGQRQEEMSESDYVIKDDGFHQTWIYVGSDPLPDDLMGAVCGNESKDDYLLRRNAKCFRNNFRNDMKPKEEPKAKQKPWTEKVTDFSPRMGK